VGFWRQQDAATIAARWAAVVPASRIHIITVPQAGAPKDLLWRRFCQVIGVDPAIIDLSGVPTSGNVSLRPPQARLLRRVNQRLKGTLTPSVYRTVVKRYLSESATASATTTSVYGLSEEQRAMAARWSDDLRTAVAAGGYTVIGDLDELTAPPAVEEASVRPFDEVPDSEEAEATVMATAALVRWMATSPQTDDGPPPRSDHSG
jgi:hypothetical protein